LRSAASGGDTKTLHRAAHSLKGQSGSVGARRVQIVSRLLEELAGRGDLRGTAALLTQLEDEFARARDALGDALTQPRSHLTESSPTVGT